MSLWGSPLKLAHSAVLPSGTTPPIGLPSSNVPAYTFPSTSHTSTMWSPHPPSSLLPPPSYLVHYSYHNVCCQAYVGDTVDDKPHKRNSVRLAIRYNTMLQAAFCTLHQLCILHAAHTLILHAAHTVHFARCTYLHQEGDVRTQQARGPAQCRGERKTLM